MTRKISFILLVFTCFASYSQDQIDSLQNLLEGRSGNQDSATIDLLNELSYQYWTLDPKTAVEYGQKALIMAQDIVYDKGQAFSFRSLGVSNWAQGNYDEALDYLLESLLLYQALSDTLNIANVMMNTALIYSDQGSNDQALRYYLEALDTFKELGRSRRYVNTANHIGELFLRENKFDEARQYFQRALSLSDSLEHHYGKATSYQNLGDLYIQLGELDSGLMYASNAVEMQKEISDLNGWGISLYLLAQANAFKKNFRQADLHYEEAMEIASGLNSKKLKRDIYLGSSNSKKAQGDWEGALICLEKFQVLDDSLQQAETVRKLTRLENKVELEKKQQELLEKEYELNILEKEANIDMLYRNILVIIILAVLLLSYLIWKQQQLKLKSNRALLIKNEQLAEKEHENAQLKEQELQQELHFKNKELTSYTVNFVQKNELLGEIKTGLNRLKKVNNSNKEITQLLKLVDAGHQIDREWSDFKKHFEDVHKDFFSVLKSQFPDITQNELKLCALLKLNMNLKEAASVLGISPESVKTARYRLRKKLGLSKEDNLVDYIINLEGEL